MYVMTAESRDSNAKVKKLRREGFVLAAYGGKLEETLLIQVTAQKLAKLLREKAIGTQVLIELGGKAKCSH